MLLMPNIQQQILYDLHDFFRERTAIRTKYVMPDSQRQPTSKKNC